MQKFIKITLTIVSANLALSACTSQDQNPKFFATAPNYQLQNLKTTHNHPQVIARNFPSSAQPRPCKSADNCYKPIDKLGNYSGDYRLKVTSVASAYPSRAHPVSRLPAAFPSVPSAPRPWLPVHANHLNDSWSLPPFRPVSFR